MGRLGQILFLLLIKLSIRLREEYGTPEPEQAVVCQRPGTTTICIISNEKLRAKLLQFTAIDKIEYRMVVTERPNSGHVWNLHNLMITSDVRCLGKVEIIDIGHIFASSQSL